MYFVKFFYYIHNNAFIISNLQYPHMEQSVHNIFVVIMLVVSYASLLIYLSVQGAQSDNQIRMSKLQRQTFVQCFLVCIGTFVTALIYVSCSLKELTLD